MRYFLSYSRRDLSFVQRFYYDDPYDFWFDLQDIHPNTDWAQSIKQGIEVCDALVLVASPFALASANVQDEWLYALDVLHKPVFVLLIANCELPPQLRGCPLYDLRADPFDPIERSRARSLSLYTVSDHAQLPARVLPAYVRKPVLWMLGIQVLWTVIVLSVLWAMQASVDPRVLLAAFALTLWDGWIVLHQTAQIRRRTLPQNRLMSRFMFDVLIKVAVHILLILGALIALYGIDLRRITGSPAEWPSILLSPLVMVLQFAIFNTLIVGRRYTPATTSQNAIVKRRLYGWLPVSPFMGKLRDYDISKESAFTRLAQDTAITTSRGLYHEQEGQRRVCILYAPEDLHFVRYLAANLHSETVMFASQVFGGDLPALFPGEDPPKYVTLPEDTQVTLLPYPGSCTDRPEAERYLLVVSPYALNGVKAFVERHPCQLSRMIPLLLQSTNGIPDVLGKTQWVDARQQYRRAVYSTAAILSLNAFPGTPGQMPLMAEILGRQPYAAGVWIPLLFGLMILLPSTVAAGLVVLIQAITLTGSMLPVDRYDTVVRLFLSLAQAGLGITLVLLYWRSYWNRSRSLHFMALLVAIIGLQMAITDIGGQDLPAELIGLLSGLGVPAMAVLLLLRADWREGIYELMADMDTRLRHRFPNMPGVVINQHIYREGISEALDIWKPNRSFEWRLAALIMLLYATIFIANGVVTWRLPHDPAGRLVPPWADPVTMDDAGPFPILNFQVGTKLMTPADGTPRLSDPVVEFRNIDTLYAVLEFRDVPDGTEFVFSAYFYRDLFSQTTTMWNEQIAWDNAQARGYLTLPFVSDGPITPGYYELIVQVNGIYAARTTFTIVD